MALLGNITKSNNIDIEQCLKEIKDNLKPNELELLAKLAKSNSPVKGIALKKLRELKF